MADKVYLDIIPDLDYKIQDPTNGQEYTLAKAKELYEKELVIEGPAFKKLRVLGFDLKALKEYYR